MRSGVGNGVLAHFQSRAGTGIPVRYRKILESFFLQKILKLSNFIHSLTSTWSERECLLRIDVKSNYYKQLLNEIFVPSTLYGTMPLIWRLPSIGNFTSVKFSSIDFNLLKNHGEIIRPFAFIRFARDFHGDSSWRLWLVRNITNAQYQPTQNPHHNLFAFLRKSFI